MARTSTKTSKISHQTRPTTLPTHPPQPTQHPSQHPSPPSNVASNNRGMFSSMADGFSFGLGSSIAHRVVNGLFSSSTTKVETPKKIQNLQDLQDTMDAIKLKHIAKPEYIAKPECKVLQDEYLKCIQFSYAENQSSCDFNLNLFRDCEYN